MEQLNPTCLKTPLAILCMGTFLFNIACNKSSSSDASTSASSNPIYDLKTASFSVPPVDTTDLLGIVPLGNLNPTAHVFPTDHMYLSCFSNKTSLNVKAPGNVQVMRITRVHFNAGAFNDHYEYKIAMGSQNSFMYWDHIINISARLITATNNFSGGTCNPTYSTGGSSSQECYFEPIALMASPGEVLGTVNISNGKTSFDLGVYVNSVPMNPLEYFDANARAMMEAKLGSSDGRIRRTTPPISGEINYDQPGTVMGNWIKQGSTKFPEDNNIALVKDNVTPSIQVFSAGNTLPGLPSGTYYFLPKSSGFVNRNFAEVKSDGNIYCYTLDLLGFVNIGNSIPSTSILVRLDGGASMTAEKRNCDCTCIPYQFTANKVSYTR